MTCTAGLSGSGSSERSTTDFSTAASPAVSLTAWNGIGGDIYAASRTVVTASGNQRPQQPAHGSFAAGLQPPFAARHLPLGEEKAVMRYSFN